MTWTATLNSITSDPNSGNIVANITYSSDDGRSFTPNPFNGNDLTDAAIQLQISRVLNVLNTRDAAFAAITLQPGPIDVSQISPVDPVAFANASYAGNIQALQALNIVNAAVAAGTLQNTDPLVTTAQANFATAQTNLATAQSALPVKAKGP